jgi:hypothetical protein
MTIDDIKQLLAIDEVESVDVRADGSVAIVKRAAEHECERMPHGIRSRVLAEIAPSAGFVPSPWDSARRIC